VSQYVVVVVCRICEEDDAVSSLEDPCNWSCLRCQTGKRLLSALSAEVFI